MLFHSLEFLIFFAVVVPGYFMLPARLKTFWLFAASYYFYMSWSIKHTFFIAFSTVVTWICGLLLGRCRERGRWAKAVVAGSVCINLGILLVFKYSDFIIHNLNFLLAKAGYPAVQKPFDLVLPVGISFYTFQAVGYTVDVYRRVVLPEKNLLRYALFVSFFPQLVAGPIERSENLLEQIRAVPQIKRNDLFDYDRIAGGLILMLWGFFMKLVIADRLCVFVDHVYGEWYFYGTVELIAATAAFSIQIYCDFASYSTIAMGAAKVMGFTLMENFRTPYFSRSIREFWHRWHISLSTWLKDYLYIPLGGSRCGTVRRYLNLMLTFLVSGLWHGASWHYVCWGAIHGIYQTAGAATAGFRRRLRRRAGVSVTAFSFRIGQIAVTYALTLFALIFFRAESLKSALGCIQRIVTRMNIWVLSDGTLCELGLEAPELVILSAALMILLLVSLIREHRNETLDLFLARQSTWFRWLVLFILFAFLFLFGMYGPEYDENQFIYFQF